MFDSHCHLNLYKNSQIEETISRANASGVILLHTIATSLEEHSELLKICTNQDHVYCSVGIHPNNIKKSDINCCEKLKQLAQGEKKVISIGETGLDYYYQKTEKKLQQKVFIEHINAAKQLKLPIVVHSRNAEADTAKILKSELTAKEVPVILHSFASSRELFDAALENDWYISFSGIVTFKNAKDIQQCSKDAPSNRILVETDAPYLAPVPKRGQQNYPEFIPYIVDFLKNLRSQPNLAEVMMENFLRVFTKVNL